MFPDTIRWRLPLSYAAIALVATLALGAVLLVTVRGYYSNREQLYLNGNARTISEAIATTVEQKGQDWLAAVRESQLTGLAFLSQARVQVLDADGQVLADSGPATPRTLLVSPFNAPVPPLLQNAQDRLFDKGSGILSKMGITGTKAAIIFINREIVNDEVKGYGIVTRTLFYGANPIAPGLPLSGTDMPDVLFTLPAYGTPFGFGLGNVAEWDGRRSSQVVRIPFQDKNSTLLGYVQLSEGPAYGGQIVDSVARGWAIASIVAVVLAIAVGLLISRRISTPLLALTNVTTRMAGGELSARANVMRGDELGELASSFNVMAGQVEETIVMLRRFIADAAHELNTPLTALRTNLELLSEEPDQLKLQTFAGQAQAQVDRLQALTGGLLDLSRLESSKSRQQVSLDLSALVQRTSEVYASRAEQCGVSFATDTPAQTAIVVVGDSDQLERALGNLLDNALKFTPPGGAITLGIHHNEDEWVEVFVEDTGIGIPPEDLPQLFNRFHRGRNAATYPGSGLGLAIAKAIVDGHGGKVTATNTANGARFSIRLPAGPASGISASETVDALQQLGCHCNCKGTTAVQLP